MLDLEMISLALRGATLLVAAASLGVVIVALRTVRVGIVAMTENARQRAAEHDKRHTEAMQRLDRNHTESMRILETLIERTAPALATD